MLLSSDSPRTRNLILYGKHITVAIMGYYELLWKQYNFFSYGSICVCEINLPMLWLKNSLIGSKK